MDRLFSELLFSLCRNPRKIQSEQSFLGLSPYITPHPVPHWASSFKDVTPGLDHLLTFSGKGWLVTHI